MQPAAIGPYKIERELGRGGMGEVYLAHDARLDRHVAVKALPPHMAQEPERLARFQREARVLASLNHPNIAAIYGLEEADAHQYLILEFIDGETLADRLVNGPVPVDEALSLARQIAEALEAAHEKGIIHRDLKPGNVMINQNGQVKVLDFGLARTAEGPVSSTNVTAKPDSATVTTPARHSPTIPGAIMGTAGYMSPEQVRGEVVDARSDVFSLGVVLWEMVTGRRLFAADTELEELRLILSGPIEPPDQVEPSVPEPLGRVAMRALERDKHKRFASARDFARALATECGDLHFDVDECAAFMKDRFASKMESTRKLFEAAAATVSEAEVEEAARAYRDSRQHDEKGKTPARPRVAAAKSPKVSANKLPQVSASKLPKASANKLKPVGASARKLPLVETDTEAQVPVAPAPTGERPAVKNLLVVGALAIVVAVGALVVWKLAGGAPVAEEGGLGPVTPDIAAIPGAGGPEDEPDTPADVPPQKAADSRPGDSRTSEPKTPSKAKGEVTLVLLPEGTVTKGKQELGRGMMMTFSLPVGTHLVTVVGPDGVKRKLSLPVQQGKNKPLKLQVAELPAQ